MWISCVHYTTCPIFILFPWEKCSKSQRIKVAYFEAVLQNKISCCVQHFCFCVSVNIWPQGFYWWLHNAREYCFVCNYSSVSYHFIFLPRLVIKDSRGLSHISKDIMDDNNKTHKHNFFVRKKTCSFSLNLACKNMKYKKFILCKL